MAPLFTKEEGETIRKRYAEIVAEIAQKREAFDRLSPFDRAEWFPKIAIEGGVTAGIEYGRKAYFSKNTTPYTEGYFKKTFGLAVTDNNACEQMELSIIDTAIMRFNDITRDFNAVRGQGGRLKETRVIQSPRMKFR